VWAADDVSSSPSEEEVLDIEKIKKLLEDKKIRQLLEETIKEKVDSSDSDPTIAAIQNMTGTISEQKKKEIETQISNDLRSELIDKIDEKNKNDQIEENKNYKKSSKWSKIKEFLKSNQKPALKLLTNIFVDYGLQQKPLSEVVADSLKKWSDS